MGKMGQIFALVVVGDYVNTTNGGMQTILCESAVVAVVAVVMVVSLKGLVVSWTENMSEKQKCLFSRL